MLQDLGENERQVGRLRERIERLEAELTRVTPRLEGMPGGADRDRMAEGVAQIVDLEKELLRRIANLERERLRIEDEISALPEQQRRVITARYVEKKPWKKVVKEMHYDRRWTFRIHDAAIRRLEGKPPETSH